METRKPTTRTVAQRKVYGKRSANAPRAVLDQKIPARETCKAVDATVEAIESKLAKISINEKSTHLPQAAEAEQHTENPEKEEQNKISHTHSPDESPSPITEPQSTDTPTEQSSKKSSEKKRYDEMVEVRIPPLGVQGIYRETQLQRGIPAAERRPGKKTFSRRSSGFVHDPKANTYVRPILNEAHSPIASQNIQRFDNWASRSAKMFHVAKLAEGSYGEVYKLHLREEAARPVVSKSKLAKLRAYGDGVFKVVPLRAKSGPGSKKFTSIEEIVSETRMLKYLDPIPGFARFREIHVVRGRFPEPFQKAWEYYKETKDDCLNPNPASKKSYPDSQLWAIVEMDDAGCELEKFSWSSIFQVYDIFWGVAMALARAEEYAMFEVSFNKTRRLLRAF